jgi:beta-lactamase class A
LVFGGAGAVLVFGLGALVGDSLDFRGPRNAAAMTRSSSGVFANPSDSAAAECRERFHFLNANAVCWGAATIRKVDYKETQVTVASYLAGERMAGRLLEGAVYFRDLQFGPTFGVHHYTEFSPASLMKLPIAFVFLAGAEIEPGLLQVQRSFDGSLDTMVYNPEPGKSAEPYRKYSVSELLKMMISYSDNISTRALDNFLDETAEGTNVRLQTFQELGILDPRDRMVSTVSVKGYSALFRILYNASFLTNEYSQQLLDWLSNSDYNNGLRAGVPGGIRIAHKFGRRSDGGQVRQLHDCGIVYYPGNPYSLCVMTRGSDYQDLERIVARISKMLYEEVDARRIDQLQALH